MISIGIIPARGGSKSIPLKNIKLFNGKPLIEYTIESALKSGVLDKIVVSTDHDDIAKVCTKYTDIDVIFRPKKLSTDEALTESALLYVCDELEKRENFIPDIVLTLEPTSPMRTPQTIIKSIDILKKQNFDSVIGVVESLSVYGKIVNGYYEHLFPNQARRRQDREPLYKECSTIYATTLQTLRLKNSVIGDKIYPLIIKKNEAIDINDKYDFLFAEALQKNRGIVSIW
jgi:CMP-N,N'-diacetyllegionaminic acid synthase